MWVNSQGWLASTCCGQGTMSEYFVDVLSTKDSCEKKKNDTNW